MNTLDHAQSRRALNVTTFRTLRSLTDREIGETATASAARELFTGGQTQGLTIAADHAVLFAFLWPLILSALFIPLSIRAYRRLS